MKTTRANRTSETHIAALAESVRNLEAPFSCGGAVELAGPVELCPRGGRPIPIQEDDGWRRKEVGKRLMKLCAPAPFGVGRETRYDPRVRNGGQLLAAGGAFRIEGLDLKKSGILEEIRRVLCPQDAGLPEAELYALNVYDSRGHFVSHKDTPRDSNVFGTLVVCLPVSFRGGRLVIRHDSTRSFRWERPDYFGYGGRVPDRHRIHWAAFYSDVDHEIEPVKGGTRVTLTWLLRRSASGEIVKEVSDTKAELEGAFAAALADPRFMPAGGTLGVPCAHLYPEANGPGRSSNKLSRQAASRLKGRDHLVALAALGAGLTARYRPYLFETGGNESWRLARGPSRKESAMFEEYRLGATELERTLPIEHHVDWNSKDDVTWIRPPPWADDPDLDPARDAEPATSLLGTPEYSATDYFGNEGSDSAFYVSAALLLGVPPARSRSAKPTSASRRPRVSRVGA